MSNQHVKRFVIVVICLLVIVPLVHAQETTQSEREAMYDRYLEYPSLVKGGSIEPHWMAAGSSFWHAEGVPAVQAPVPASPQIFRLVVAVPPSHELVPWCGSVAVSADGERLAFVAAREGVRRLFLRKIDEFEAVVIAGTEDAFDPFFSSDGQWVGFFAEDKLKKVSVRGGPPVTVCDAANSRGASWGPDDTIVFAAGSPTSLSRVSSGGGMPEILTTPDPEQREFGHLWPELLPNGRAVLFAIDTGGGFDNALIAVQSVESGERKILLEGGTAPHYAPTGHLVYAREEKLLAVPFNLEELAVTGQPLPVLENVWVNSSGLAQFSFSKDGLLAYIPAHHPEAKRRLVWVNRKGGVEPLPAPERAYWLPRLSPNGQRVAVVITGPTSDIWTYDLQSNKLTQLTSEIGLVDAPVWTPDGNRVAFSARREGRFNLYWQAADGSASEENLWVGQYWHFPFSWSPDGKVLIFGEHYPPTGWDILVLRLGDKPEPFLRSPFHEGGAVFSPSGHWIAYISLESGASEVYVQPFPRSGKKWQVSTEGGTEPVWSRDGRELFYRKGNMMMVIPIQTSPSFNAGKPRLLFEGRFQAGYPGQPNYDVASDGRRFLMVESEWEPTVTKLNVVLNWFEELKQRMGN